MNKQSLFHPKKRTSIAVSEKNTSKVEIEKHFEPNKLDSARHDVETLPIIPETDLPEPAVKTKPMKQVKMRRKVKPACMEGTKTSLDLHSSISLDKKVELLNKQIAEIEHDIEYGFNFSPRVVEMLHNTPVQSQISEPDSAFTEDVFKDLDPPIFTKNSPEKMFQNTKTDKLVDAYKFNKLKVAKDDPSYVLRSEIAEYRKNLKKDVLSDKILKILSKTDEKGVCYIQCVNDGKNTKVDSKTEMKNLDSEQLDPVMELSSARFKIAGKKKAK